MTFNEFSQFVESLLDGISSITGKYLNRAEVEYKSDNSPVTFADREIENYLVSRIRERFPSHTVVGEESGTHVPNNLKSKDSENAQEAELEWVLDPIDGTKSFIHGVPLFTTLIGVMKRGKSLYGAIYNPIQNELLTGDGLKAYMNGKSVSMKPCTQLEDAILLATDILAMGRHWSMDGFMDLALRCRMLRTWGDAYGYAMLATGRGDIMIDAKMSRWDIAALIPIIRGAGGVITGYDGGEPETAKSMVAANPALHSEVIKILHGR